MSKRFSFKMIAAGLLGCVWGNLEVFETVGFILLRRIMLPQCVGPGGHFLSDLKSS